MSAAGVVAVEPSEGVESGLALVRPPFPALECLAFEGRVEGLGECVVRAGTDRAHASPKVGDGLSMTVTARTEEETQFLSVAAEYSEWIEPDDLPAWERELQAAAQSLVASTDLGPGLCVSASRHD